MKRKLIGLMLLLTLAIGGCGQEVEKVNKTSPESEERQTNTKSVIIYYVDWKTEEIVQNEITIEGELPGEIVKILKENELLHAGCEVQNVFVNEEENTMVIDINADFGNYIRNMGINGAEQIIECTAKSFMSSYDCEKIKITEDGTALDTGHTVLEGYISYK